MGIRGFGNILGEQQTGDVGNVGIDLFFEMLFERLSKRTCNSNCGTVRGDWIVYRCKVCSAHDECAPTIRSVVANIHSVIHEAATNSKGYMKNIHAEMDIQHKLEVPFKYMRPPRIRSCVWELPWYEEVKINCYGCSPSNPGMAGSKVEECNFIFEAKTIQRMELLVLSTLKWRMRVVTPFTFMDYFFRKNNDDLPPPSSQISRLVELILRLTRGIEYLEFKPSEVDAAVSIFVIRETNLDKYEPYFIKNVQKERVFKFLELIYEHQRSAAVQFVPHNPIEVLDVSCLSYKSDELPTVSSTNSSQENSNFKRVNLNKPSDMD
ncbi:hypothetical protein GIB67_023294 [Kingdonia uniflora]|uniref:Uncharacterized protein n=1 Tax=Kingdonia uniflora TaxID=39325 RepID=A0A7J7LG77_9MAGN|nr:hypothetical protein GIB67_023294 [Kingdonia uniflora]